MVEYILNYQLESKEMRDAFLKELKDNHVDEISAAEKGCLKYTYYLPLDSDRNLALVEIWDTIEDQQRHASQEHFKHLQEIKAKYNVITECETYGE